MPTPDMVVLAQGELPTGEHWMLKAGGTRNDYYTVLETVHPDGHRDTGGMGGPVLATGQLMNVYTGGSDRGLRRVLARTDPQVAALRVELTSGGSLELSPVATQTDLGVVFFAALLLRTVGLASITAIDKHGHVLEPQDLSTHEAHWRRFLRGSEPPGT